MNLTIVQISLAFLLSLYMRFVRRTSRWSIDNADLRTKIQAGGRGFIICAWHSRFMMTPAVWTKMVQTPHVLISKSRDGNLVAYVSKFLGLGVVRGSRRAKYKEKNKRGTEALREMRQVIEANDGIVMTPDGPRGPRMRLAQGPIQLAKLTGAPLIAYGLSTSQHKLFSSWDRFMLPLPFGRGKIVLAGPLFVPPDADAGRIEELRRDFENLLNSATQKADRDVGNEPVLPAEARQVTR